MMNRIFLKEKEPQMLNPRNENPLSIGMEKSWRKNIKGGSFGIIFEKFCPYIKDL
jgi:hypothetical protein